MGSGSIRETPYAVIDLETTGLSGRRDCIIELAIVHVDRGGRRIVLDTLVRPEKRIGNREVHGISNRDVRKAPTLDEIADRVIDALAGRVLVAHNARFDLAFLGRALDRWGHPSAIPSICTMELHRHLAGDKADLATASLQLGLSLDGPLHRASADALAASALFERHLDTLSATGHMRWCDVEPSVPRALIAFDQPLLTGRGAQEAMPRSALLPRGASPPATPAEAPVDRAATYRALVSGALDDPRPLDGSRLGALASELSSDELAGCHAGAFAEWLSRQARAGALDHAARLRVRGAITVLSKLGWAPGD